MAIDQCGEYKPLRVETPAQDVEHSKTRDKHADQTQKSRSLRIQRTEMHQSGHEIGKEQKQPTFEEDDTTINLNGSCGATLLRRPEKSFEHLANLFRHFERSRERSG